MNNLNKTIFTSDHTINIVPVTLPSIEVMKLSYFKIDYKLFETDIKSLRMKERFILMN